MSIDLKMQHGRDYRNRLEIKPNYIDDHKGDQNQTSSSIQVVRTLLRRADSSEEKQKTNMIEDSQSPAR